MEVKVKFPLNVRFKHPKGHFGYIDLNYYDFFNR